MKAKKFFKGALVYILDAMLIMVLVLLAYFTVFTTVTANPAQVKKIIDESGVYSKITPVLYDKYVREARSGAGEIRTEGLPLDNETVKNAATSVFSGDFIKQNLEAAIDGTYLWLNGDLAAPSFSINLAEAKNRFAGHIAEHAGARAETLPLCTPQQLREVRGTDLLSLPCRPAGTNIAALKAEFIDSINKDDGFLKDTVISPQTLKDKNGQEIFADYKKIPETFQALKNLPYILGILAALISMSIVLLNDSRREGLKKLIKFFVIGGALVILIPLGISSLVDSLLSDPATDAVVKELISPLANRFIDTADKVYYTVGVIYLLIAGAIFLAYKRMRTPAATKPEKL